MVVKEIIIENYLNLLTHLNLKLKKALLFYQIIFSCSH